MSSGTYNHSSINESVEYCHRPARLHADIRASQLLRLRQASVRAIFSFKREQQHLPQSPHVDTIAAAAAGVRARQTAVAWWQRDLHVICAIETQQVNARCHIRIVGGVAQW